MLILKEKILELNVPTINNRIYTKECFESVPEEVFVLKDFEQNNKIGIASNIHTERNFFICLYKIGYSNKIYYWWIWTVVW